MQLYDYKTKKNRIIFGPDMVQLGPDEHFTLLNLSGGKPKKESVIQTGALQLGPDFMTDIFIVETSDHAKVSLSLTYSWHFKKPETQQDCVKLFNVKDFVGDACKSIASRIRGSISAIPFETLHYNSSQKIKEAVFGIDKTTKELRSELHFKSNNLIISSVDVRNIEITDVKTRQCLQQSINLSIEIQSKSQEATSRHQAEKMDQEARGHLERMKLEDLAKAETSQIELLKLKADSNYVRISGDAIANAKAKAEADEIQANAQLKNSQLTAQADMIELEQELENQKREMDVEYEHMVRTTDLEISKKREMAEIETKKFVQIVSAIGKETLVAISKVLN